MAKRRASLRSISSNSKIATKTAWSFAKGWFFIPQIVLAIGVLTSSIGVRARRFFGFALGGTVGKVSSKVLSAPVWGEGSQILIGFGAGGLSGRVSS